MAFDPQTRLILWQIGLMLTTVLILIIMIRESEVSDWDIVKRLLSDSEEDRGDTFGKPDASSQPLQSQQVQTQVQTQNQPQVQTQNQPQVQTQNQPQVQTDSSTIFESSAPACTASRAMHLMTSTPMVPTPNPSAHITILCLYQSKPSTPQHLPEAFISTAWSGVIFGLAHCLPFPTLFTTSESSSPSPSSPQLQSRTVSIPHLSLIQHLASCLPTMFHADPRYQSFFSNSGVGTTVRHTKVLSENEIEHVDRMCIQSHSFSVAVAYMTALVLAGLNGSILEVDMSHTKTNPQANPAPVPNAVRWTIDSKHGAEYQRHFFGHSAIVDPSAMKSSVDMLRRIAYHYILGTDLIGSEAGARSVSESQPESARAGLGTATCRVILYDRIEEPESPVSNVKKWVDAEVVQQSLQSKFPESKFLLLHKLPPRFADLVLLLSGTDVVVGAYGRWAVETMFVREPMGSAVVMELPRDCTASQSGGDSFLRFMKAVVGVRQVRVGCSVRLDGMGVVVNEHVGGIESVLREMQCR